MNDLKFAFRQLLKNPGFTAVAVLTLALGIGANTTVFSWIRGTLVNVLPGVQEQDHLVVICPQHQGGSLSDTCSYPDAREFLRMTNVFSGVVGSQCGLANLRIDHSVHWIWAQPFTASAFNVLGVSPILGRGFLPEEEFQPGGHPVAVISYGLWQGKFGGDTNVVGRIVEMNQRPFVVVGVAPPAFLGTMGGCRMDLWVPVSMNRALGLGPSNLQQRTDRWMHTLARLQPGVSVAQAQAAVTATAKQLESAYPDTNREVGFRVLPLWKAPYGGQSGMRPLLQALGAMAVMVLLIVIANLASLQLVRAADRAKEMAVRLALGARGRTILRQLLTESVVLAGLGGTLGVLFSGWAIHSLQHFLPRTYMPIAYEFGIDGGVLGAAVALSVATGVLFGLAPAWQAMHVNQVAALKEGGRAGTGAGPRQRLRSGFVVAEIALAVPLLICAGLAYASFQFAKRENVGLDPNQVLLAGLRLESDGYDDTTGRVFVRKLRQRLAEIPGVESVTAGNWLPLGFEGGSTAGVHVDGYTESPGEFMSVGTSSVGPDYFKTFRIPVREGREFRESDDANALPVTIINEEVARRFFAGRNPIGGKIRYWGVERTIVGVVKNGKYRSLNEPQQPFVYAPYEQHYESHLGVALRVAGDPYAFASQLRAAIKEVNPAVEPFTLLRMVDYIGAAYLLPRIASSLLVGVSLVTLFLSSLGIYGVMAYLVSQRTREIGIRIALGAAKVDIYKLVLHGGLKLALTGVTIGLAASIALTRLMAGLLIGVTPTDPFTLTLAVVLLTIVALAACYFPARRATKVDPMEALRYE